MYYVGATFEVAFLETIVRNLRKGNPDSLSPSASDLDNYVQIPITVQTHLDLIDLRGGKAAPPACRPTLCLRVRTVFHNGQAWPSISVPTIGRRLVPVATVRP